MTTNAVSKSGRAHYHKEALHQIRAALLPYAHDLPRERLSPQITTLQEEDGPAYCGYLYGQTEGPRIIRKSSFEREVNHLSAYPEGSNISSRSDSPCFLGHGTSYQNTACAVKQYEHHISLENCYMPPNRSHGYVGGPVSENPPPPPPPPPPRSQGISCPTPPLGTPGTPIYPNSGTSTTMVTSVGHMPVLYSRLSPGPNKTKPANYVNVNNISQGSTPQRGTSPVSFNSRPVVVQNGIQAQQQLTQQMQALAVNGTSLQIDKPPPYPQVPQLKYPPNIKLAASPLPSSQNRKSPTQECRMSPAQLNFQVPSPMITSHPASPCSLSPTSSTSPTLVMRGGQAARQAKTPTPIFMQSAKSTQVQRPVLQTAVAPTSPQVTAPSLPYHFPQKQAQLISSGMSAAHVSSQESGSVHSQSSVYSQSGLSANNAINSIPTTEPPSYHSAMQELAAAKGYNYIPVQEIPVQEIGVQELDISSTPLAQIPISEVANSDSIAPQSLNGIGTCHSPLQVKLSPVTIIDTASVNSRSESPVSSVVSQDTHACSQSPVSCLSAAAQSDMTLESGYSSCSQSVRGIPPPPPHTPSPPLVSHVEKTMHHSPIPERKKVSKDIERQRSETKVKIYSPEAYKFYMEQRVENVFKALEQRNRRKLQLKKEMDKVGLPEQQQLELLKLLYQKESNYIRSKRAKMNKSMFEKLETIGLGAFGEVSLVRKIDNNQLYAMKTLRKSDVLKRNQVAHVKAERDILAEADSEWVVKLYYSFQDLDKLYFIMDYIPGGDLMSLLIKFGTFQEHFAKFYVGELVCAIDSVHNIGFIHRDIKPDNILIDRDGHIKLTDFGLCTGFRWTHNSKYYQSQEHPRQESIDPCGDSVVCRCNDLKPLERRRQRQHLRCQAHSLVGTPNYIAPEVLSRTGYTQLCDWWSVGVILYEMLIGQPPFLASAPAETQYKVINWETTLRIPQKAKLSLEAKDLMLQLLTHPEKRLGRHGADEIKAHLFLRDLDFENGLRSQPAPYIPDLKHPQDTSNFDPIDPERLRSSEADTDQEWVNSGNQPLHGFYEFTFRRFFDSNLISGNSHSEKDNQGPVYV